MRKFAQPNPGVSLKLVTFLIICIAGMATQWERTSIYMKEILIENKQQYLIDNYPFNDPPKLTEKRLCIHCGSVITVGDYKVFKDESGEEYICCPKAPSCDGSIIDWMDVD